MTKLIDELKSKIRYTDYDEPVVDWDDLVTVVETWQSAQFATDINVGDTISRQAAIDALTRESLRLHALHWGDYPEAPDIQSGVLSSIDIIRELPPAQPQWIPSSEGKPKRDGKYIVTTPRWKIVDVKEYSVKYWWEGGTPLAWMPLPEPYGGESDEID